MLIGWLCSVGVSEGESPAGTSMNVFLNLRQAATTTEGINLCRTWPQTSPAKANRPHKKTRVQRTGHVFLTQLLESNSIV